MIPERVVLDFGRKGGNQRKQQRDRGTHTQTGVGPVPQKVPDVRREPHDTNANFANDSGRPRENAGGENNPEDRRRVPARCGKACEQGTEGDSANPQSELPTFGCVSEES